MRTPRARRRLRVRAPATTANLGPGFDCAAVALDLWNELELTEGEGIEVTGEGAEEIPTGPGHLGLRAFELVAPAAGWHFSFVNRIPLARGLGSSAATIALGLATATLSSGRELEPQRLLALGLQLESHGDNLAAALAGGVCLTWASSGVQRIARIAEDLPAVAIALIPETRVETAAARAALPQEIRHADASFTAAHAALLGAALAAGDADLLAEAFDDRLHEPYRAALAPLAETVRAHPPRGVLGATISGSGPTAIVWARREAAESCERELAERLPDVRVVRLAVSPIGAGLA